MAKRLGGGGEGDYMQWNALQSERISVAPDFTCTPAPAPANSPDFTNTTAPAPACTCSWTHPHKFTCKFTWSHLQLQLQPHAAAQNFIGNRFPWQQQTLIQMQWSDKKHISQKISSYFPPTSSALQSQRRDHTFSWKSFFGGLQRRGWEQVSIGERRCRG